MRPLLVAFLLAGCGVADEVERITKVAEAEKQPAFGELYKYGRPRTCTHEYVNMGFMHVRLVCRHCDQEKPE